MLRRSARPCWLGLVALAVIGLAAGLGLMAFLSLPHLVQVDPTPDAQAVSPRARVRLRFDRPMNSAAVAAALQIEPATPAEITWSDGGRTLTFTPHDAWPVEGVVTVSLTGGQSQAGLPLLERRQWSFTVGRERLVLLADTGSGRAANLAVISIAEGDTPTMLTDEPNGVNDFAIRPDGGQIVYSARRADGGADLRAVNPDGTGAADVLACPQVACLSPDFSPEGGRLVYERQTPVEGTASAGGFGEPRAHLLSLATGSDVTLGDSENQTRSPRWGPDGRVSFYDAVRQALVIQDPTSGGVTYIPDLSGEIGTWSPDGQSIVFPEIYLQDNTITLTGTLLVTDSASVNVAGFYSHLLRVAIATNTTQDLTGQGVVEDASPVYSGSGAWLAFGRKSLSDTGWTPGRQLWRMRAYGTQAQPLTDAPVYNHSAFAWSPDDRRLVYMRFNVIDPSEPVEVWIVNADGTGARRLVVGGYSPEWLP